MTKAPLHLCEVHRVIGWPQGPRGFFAACAACDWRGPIRQTVAQAEKDAHEHHFVELGP